MWPLCREGVFPLVGRVGQCVESRFNPCTLKNEDISCTQAERFEGTIDIDLFGYTSPTVVNIYWILDSETDRLLKFIKNFIDRNESRETLETAVSQRMCLRVVKFDD